MSIFENKSNEEHHKTYEDFYYEHIVEINKLKTQLKEAESVIDFYADDRHIREYGYGQTVMLESEECEVDQYDNPMPNTAKKYKDKYKDKNE